MSPCQTCNAGVQLENKLNQVRTIVVSLNSYSCYNPRNYVIRVNTNRFKCNIGLQCSNLDYYYKAISSYNAMLQNIIAYYIDRGDVVSLTCLHRMLKGYDTLLSEQIYNYILLIRQPLNNLKKKRTF